MTKTAAFPRVDALFAGEPPEPPLEGAGIRRKIRHILWVAIPLDLMAIPLWTGVPGALLTLWAWLLADAESRRVEDGCYDEQDSAAILGLRRISKAALIFTLLSFVVQVWLLTKPAYVESYRGIFLP